MSLSTKSFGLGVLVLIGLPFAWHHFPNIPDLSHPTSFFMTALAQDDENEGGDDGQPSTPLPPSPSTASSKTEYKTIKVTQEVIEYRPVTQTVMVTKEDYARDTDGDGLVDAIDPDPFVPQSEYFTDTDGDGVPNALDQHHDGDDFAYFDSETDNNNNGILDSYEQQ